MKSASSTGLRFVSGRVKIIEHAKNSSNREKARLDYCHRLQRATVEAVLVQSRNESWTLWKQNSSTVKKNLEHCSSKSGASWKQISSVVNWSLEHGWNITRARALGLFWNRRDTKRVSCTVKTILELQLKQFSNMVGTILGHLRNTSRARSKQILSMI